MKYKNDSFWLSYADLMTSLFFIMLVLYVFTFVRLKVQQEEYRLKAEELEKIINIKEAVSNIDTTGKYFQYNPDYEKHILSIKNIKFPSGSSEMDALSSTTKNELLNAGGKIARLLKKYEISNSDNQDEVKFLVIIEGQASKDNYARNYELSYERGLALYNFWKENNIDLTNISNCELIISGSGTGGVPRSNINQNNQRFLIHIIPKVGQLN